MAQFQPNELVGVWASTSANQTNVVKVTESTEGFRISFYTVGCLGSTFQRRSAVLDGDQLRLSAPITPYGSLPSSSFNVTTIGVQTFMVFSWYAERMVREGKTPYSRDVWRTNLLQRVYGEEAQTYTQRFFEFEKGALNDVHGE